MSAGTEFMRAAQTLPTPVLALLAKGVERMQNATVADAVAQNHSYVVGIINACVTLEKLSLKAANEFCSGAMKLCCERIGELGVEPVVVDAARKAPNFARKVH